MCAFRLCYVSFLFAALPACQADIGSAIPSDDALDTSPMVVERPSDASIVDADTMEVIRRGIDESLSHVDGSESQHGGKVEGGTKASLLPPHTQDELSSLVERAETFIAVGQIERAEPYLVMAARYGHPWAQNELASRYGSGTGIAKDLRKAALYRGLSIYQRPWEANPPTQVDMPLAQRSIDPVIELVGGKLSDDERAWVSEQIKTHTEAYIRFIEPLRRPQQTLPLQTGE